METKRTENCIICGEELSYLTSVIPPWERDVAREADLPYLKCEHSHRNMQCSYAECRYFGGKRNP